MTTINTTGLFGTGNNANFGYTLAGVNTISNQLLFFFILLALFVIIIFMLRNYQFKDSFLSASAIVWIFSLLFWMGGYVTFAYAVVTFSLVVLAVLFSYIGPG